MSWPVAVIGFNRPAYLERTLKALRAQVRRIGRQTEPYLIERIALFQDGPVNPKSGERYATDSEIRDSITVFRRIFPKGEVFTSKDNLGIAANIDRAERYIFDELQADAGMFFEDDLVTTRFYLQALDAMLNMALADDRVGYVACYGLRWLLPLEEQAKDPTAYERLVHHWGFGLTRRQYLKSKPYVDDYLSLISDSDYLKPKLQAIYRLLESWGVGALLPAQDVIRAAICCKTGSVRLNTRACLGKYIGADGTHHNPQIYEKQRYGQTILYREPLTDFPSLTDEQYRSFVARQDSWLRYTLTPQAKQWMVGIGLAERNWPEFGVVFKPSGQLSNIDRYGRRRI